MLAIPVAAGVLYPSLRILLAPQLAALPMNASTVIVTVNALLLRAGTPRPAVRRLSPDLVGQRANRGVSVYCGLH